MSLRRRLVLVALAYVGVLGLGGIALAATFSAWSRSLDDRRDLLSAASAVADLQSSYLNQETGQRGYVITGEDVFLTPYEQGADTATASAADVLRLAGDRPDVAQALADVQRAAETWRTEAAQPEIDARRNSGADAAAQLLEEGRGRVLFDDLRARLGVLRTVVDARADAEMADAEELQDAVTAILVILLAGVVVLTGVVAWLLQRWAVRPLLAIKDAAGRVAAGEPVRVEIIGPPEMIEVAAAVDAMQATIGQQRDAAVRAREAIEQNTVLALQLRTELTSELGEYPEGWTVAAGLRAAEGVVAGDCYDVTLIGPNEIGVIVIDISGHGALAAVAAFKCKELLKAALRSDLEPGACLDWLTSQELGLDDRFFTAFVATVDTRTGACRYANAGHPPALVVTEGGAPTHLSPTGPLFGYGRPGWTTGQAVIEPRSVLAVYTDGLVETRDAARTFYGEERLTAILDRMSCDEADAVVEGVLADLTEFKPGRLADDVTLVVLCRAHTGAG